MVGPEHRADERLAAARVPECGQKGGQAGQRRVRLLLTAHEAEGRMGNEPDAAPFPRQVEQRLADGDLHDRVGEQALRGQMFESPQKIALHREAEAADRAGALKIPEPGADFLQPGRSGV